MRRCPPGLRDCWFALAAVVLFSLVAQMTGLAQGRAADARSGKCVFILDGSSRMDGQVQGKPKIEISREVLAGLIDESPAAGSVGLVGYGPRQKRDCSEVEELSPLSPEIRRI
jgi:Ca-activated chloride channel homolog